MDKDLFIDMETREYSGARRHLESHICNRGAQMHYIRIVSVVLLLAFTGNYLTAHAADDMHVIVNAAAPVDTLSRTTLRAIISMRIRQWPDGTPIMVYVLPDRDDRHREFCKEILRVFPYVLRDTWDRLVFTGTGQAPIEIQTQEELIRYVARTPGAIGYARLDTDIAHEHTRTLEVH